MVLRRFRFGAGSREIFREARHRNAMVATWHFSNLGVTVGELIEADCSGGGVFLLKVVGCDDYFLDQVPPEAAARLGFDSPAAFCERVHRQFPSCREDEVVSVIQYRVLAQRGGG